MRPLFFALTLLAAPLFAGQNVVVVLDDSGSMDGSLGSITRMEAAKESLYAVLGTLPKDAKVGVILLNNGWNDDKWAVPLDMVDLKKVKSAIAKVTANGGTPLGASMKFGADRLLEARSKEHYGTYRLLIVSDGEASDSHLVDKYITDILSRGLTVDVIGVDMSSNHSLATKVHTYRSADDPESLTKAISEVFAESDGDSDSGQEDFELAAAFQDNEVAAAVLAALSKTGNHPIGEKPPVKPALDEQGNVQFDEEGNVVVEEGTSIATIFFTIIGFMVLGGVLFVFIMTRR